MKFYLASVLAAALPAVLAGTYPCLLAYDEPGFTGTSVVSCAMQNNQCLSFDQGTAQDDLLINHLLSAKATNNMQTGPSVGWLYESWDCSGTGKFVDFEGWADLSNDPPYHSYLARF